MQETIEKIETSNGVKLVPHPEPHFFLVGYSKTVAGEDEEEQEVDYEREDYNKSIVLTKEEIESNVIVVPHFKRIDETYRLTVKLDDPALKDICGVKVYTRIGKNGELTEIPDSPDSETIKHETDDVFIADIDMPGGSNDNQKYIVVVPYSNMPEELGFVEFWHESFDIGDNSIVHHRIERASDDPNELPLNNYVFEFPYTGVYSLPYCNVVLHATFGGYEVPEAVADGADDIADYKDPEKYPEIYTESEEISQATEGPRNEYITFKDGNNEDKKTGIYRAIKLFTFNINGVRSLKEFPLYRIDQDPTHREADHYTILFHGKNATFTIDGSSNIVHYYFNESSEHQSGEYQYLVYAHNTTDGSDPSNLKLTIKPLENQQIRYIEITYPDGTKKYRNGADNVISLTEDKYTDLEITVHVDYTEKYKNTKRIVFAFDKDHYTCTVNGKTVKTLERYYCEVGDTLNVSLSIKPGHETEAKPFGWWRNTRAYLSNTQGTFVTDNESFTYTVTKDTPKDETFIVMYQLPVYIEYDKSASLTVESLFMKDEKSGLSKEDSNNNYYSVVTALGSVMKITYNTPKTFKQWNTIEYDNNGQRYYVPCKIYDGFKVNGESVRGYRTRTENPATFMVDRKWRLYPETNN